MTTDRSKQFTKQAFNLLRQTVLPRFQDVIVDSFHELYYNSDKKTWRDTYWMGTITKKCPLDLWIYQEIIFETQPDIIIESGTSDGGSALFLASLCDLMHRGKVLTIDVMYLEERKELLGERYRPEHKRIFYLHGSSISQTIFQSVKNQIEDGARVMVILDSYHVREHVAKELELYSTLVTKDCYLIVEDTNLNGHPVRSDFGPGPMEALEQFLQEHDEFEVDGERQKFLLTFNPKGYLRRVR